MSRTVAASSSRITSLRPPGRVLRPSRPWRSPLQARDLRDETPWAALPPSCLPCSLPSLPPCVTAHHAPPSLPRPVELLTLQSVSCERVSVANSPLCARPENSSLSPPL